MSRLASTFTRIKKMRMENFRWIAVAFASLLTHVTSAQVHQDLAAVIASGNDVLSEAVYGLNTTAYGTSSGLEIAGEGAAEVLKFKANDFNALNFNDALLNEVSTVVIRFNEENLLDATFNGSLLAGMENLDNVVILCTVDVPSSRAASIALNNLPTGVNSYYVISIPE